ncbi:MAG: hypothetical protein CMJ74_12205 [Planctomycetaceae bacterium]|nr:hypothetical protein [Planctomycetaceae bacterium]
MDPEVKPGPLTATVDPECVASSETSGALPTGAKNTSHSLDVVSAWPIKEGSENDRASAAKAGAETRQAISIMPNANVNFFISQLSKNRKVRSDQEKNPVITKRHPNKKRLRVLLSTRNLRTNESN